jgi:hypothetical protein
MPGSDLFLKLIHLPVKLLEMRVQSRKKFAAGPQQAVLSILQDFRHPPLKAAYALGHYDAEFAQEPANLITLGRACGNKSLPRSVQPQQRLLSTVLSATKRMLSRSTASQIASASRASFLLLFTYGSTNCGAINLTV